MPIVKFENGVSVNIEGNPTQADIEEIASQLGVSKPQEKESGILKRNWEDLKSSLNKRVDNTGEAMNRDQNVGSKTLQVLGQGFGTIGDVTGAGVSTALDAAQLKKPLEKGVQKIFETEPVKNTIKAYQGFKQEHPGAAGNIEAVGNIADALLNAIGVGATAKGAKIIGKGALEAGEVGAKGTAESFAKMVEKIASKNTPTEAMGQILQGETKDISKGFKALNSLDLGNIKTYQNLDSKISEKIKELAQGVDVDLSKDSTLRKIGELSTEIKTKGGNVAKSNFIEKALNHLSELYDKTGDIAEKADIDALIKKATDEGITKKEVNDIARKYGQEFNKKAFGKSGEALTSVNATMFENTRKGLKDFARQGIEGAEAKAKDELMSNLYNTQRLVQKNIEAVNKLKQKAEKMGIGRKALRGIIKGADMATLGGFRALREVLIQSNVGRKTMNFLDVEDALEKNLKIIQDAHKSIGTTPEKSLKSMLQNLGKSRPTAESIFSVYPPVSSVKNSSDKQ